MQEIRDGKHERSIVSTQTVDSLSTDERRAWRAIRKELEDIGISVAAFDANKNFIVNWFKTAISTGAFEEQTMEDGSSSIVCEDDFSQSLEVAGYDALLSQPLEDPRHDATLTSTPLDYQPLKLPAKAKAQRRRSPRVANLIKWLGRYNQEFFRAVESEDESKIRQILLDKDVDINVQNSYGLTALHLAARHGNETVVQPLLENGAFVDKKDSNHENRPLHFAVRCGHGKVGQLLLENGANVNEKNDYERTALHLAARFGHEMVVQFLLKNGANIDDKDQESMNALHLAAHHGHETVVQLLLKNGANIDERYLHGGTALHLATMLGQKKVVQLLLKNGANIEVKNKNGKTALQVAIRCNNSGVAKILRDARASK